jgi:hypothetical protein
VALKPGLAISARITESASFHLTSAVVSTRTESARLASGRPRTLSRGIGTTLRTWAAKVPHGATTTAAIAKRRSDLKRAPWR